MYSLSHMVTKREGGREGRKKTERKNSLSQPLQTVALCWGPCHLAWLFITLPRPLLPPALSLEIGQKQKTFSGLFWACIQPWPWMQLSKFPEQTGALWILSHLFLPGSDTLVCEPQLIFARLLWLYPSLTQEETPAAFQLSCPESQVRWKTGERTGSVLQVSPRQVRQTDTMLCKLVLLCALQGQGQSPDWEHGCCCLPGGRHDREGVEQGQVKIPKSFPTIFRRPFPGCYNHLDAVKFDCFPEFWWS